MKMVLHKFNFEDIRQIVIGAAVMAFPIAFSKDLWNYGETLPLMNIILIF